MDALALGLKEIAFWHKLCVDRPEQNQGWCGDVGKSSENEDMRCDDCRRSRRREALWEFARFVPALLQKRESSRDASVSAWA